MIHPEIEGEAGDLEQRYPGSSIAFLCTGNQLRSVAAAEYFRKKLHYLNPPFPEVIDAGVLANPKKHPHPPPIVLNEMMRRNIYVGDHVTKHVSQLTITSDTDVIAFCSPDLVPQRIIRVAKSVVYFDVPDPSYYHTSQFAVYIKHACDNLERLINTDLIPLMQDLRDNKLEETKINGVYMPDWRSTPLPQTPIWEWDKYVDENRFTR